MDINEILKQIEFPLKGTHVDGKNVVESTFYNWNDIYKQLHINEKNTIIDLNPYSYHNYEIRIIIGNPSNMYFYKQQDDTTIFVHKGIKTTLNDKRLWIEYIKTT